MEELSLVLHSAGLGRKKKEKNTKKSKWVSSISTPTYMEYIIIDEIRLKKQYIRVQLKPIKFVYLIDEYAGTRNDFLFSVIAQKGIILLDDKNNDRIDYQYVISFLSMICNADTKSYQMDIRKEDEQTKLRFSKTGVYDWDVYTVPNKNEKNIETLKKIYTDIFTETKQITSGYFKVQSNSLLGIFTTIPETYNNIDIPTTDLTNISNSQEIFKYVNDYGINLDINRPWEWVPFFRKIINVSFTKDTNHKTTAFFLKLDGRDILVGTVDNVYIQHIGAENIEERYIEFDDLGLDDSDDSDDSDTDMEESLVDPRQIVGKNK